MRGFLQLVRFQLRALFHAKRGWRLPLPLLIAAVVVGIARLALLSVRARWLPAVGERGGPRCCVVVLSYRRPANIDLIVRSALKCRFVDKVVVSNNNPDHRARQLTSAQSARLVLIDQQRLTRQGIRFALAAAHDSELYIAIDDDVFLSPKQLERLFTFLVADPSVPHGIGGEARKTCAEQDLPPRGYGFVTGVNGDREVDHLTRVYAFTREHLGTALGLFAQLGMQDLARVGNGEDIVLSFSGRSRPRIHRVGKVAQCASFACEGIATFTSHADFFAERAQIHDRLLALRGRALAPTGEVIAPHRQSGTGVRPASSPSATLPLRSDVRLRSFVIVLAGQLVSLLGSQLTGFGMSVWVYEHTGSATLFGLASASVILPRLAAQWIAGGLLDRYDRRCILLVGNLGAGACSLGLLALFVLGHLAVWNVIALTATCSIFNCVIVPGTYAIDAALVPAEYLPRTNGLRQLGTALASLSSPALGSFVFAWIGLGGLLVIDMATMLCAVAALLYVRIPNPPGHGASSGDASGVLAQLNAGARYALSNPGLRALVVVFAAAFFLFGLIVLLLIPLVLGVGDATALGIVMASAGGGALAGGLAVTYWGGPDQRARAIPLCFLVGGVCLVLGLLQPTTWLIAAAAFGYMGTRSIAGSCHATLWQTHVPAALHGRVMSFETTATSAALALAYLVGGPIIDVFEALLRRGGSLEAGLGSILGVGPGRGTALLGGVLGIVHIAGALAALRYAPLRALDAGASGQRVSRETGAPPPGAPPDTAGPIAEARRG
jgi:MFS transporter, DHA3 family, macrolide efflux protein